MKLSLCGYVVAGIFIVASGAQAADGQAVYDQGLKDAMECLIDSWGFRYPGIRSVEHKYFWAVPSVGPERRLQYLDEAYELGRGYAD